MTPAKLTAIAVQAGIVMKLQIIVFRPTTCQPQVQQPFHAQAMIRTNVARQASVTQKLDIARMSVQAMRTVPFPVMKQLEFARTLAMTTPSAALVCATTQLIFAWCQPQHLLPAANQAPLLLGNAMMMPTATASRRMLKPAIPVLECVTLHHVMAQATVHQVFVSAEYA